MSTTPFAYHDNEANHGNYQYLTLKALINEFMIPLTIDDNHLLKNTKRSVILTHAKSGIRELNQKVLNDNRTMEITVPETLYFALPHDYVKWRRVSVVVEDTTTGSLRLQPLNVNTNINVADGYLQDNDAEILFDEDGYIVLSDASNVYNQPYKKYAFTESYCGGGNPNLNTSIHSRYGEFKIDERNGKIVFSSDLADNEIVLEYRSDGLSYDTYGEDEIKIHKDAVQCLKDWISYKCLEFKGSVNRTDKYSALQRFKTTRHEAKLDRMDFNLLQLNRVMRSKSRNI